ncbi:MAG: VOC family protein [Myxococcales bacterium]|nr:VOC family protein [Myxococcales bacterium]
MSYEHGRFVWFELHTKDIDRATSFYPETLPWRIEPTKMQAGPDYWMIQAGEAGVGGVMSSQGDVPTAWVSYVSVPDVDAAAKKVVAAGGTTHMDAFDAPGVGRMQPVSDAQGGMFCLFKGETGDPPRVDGPGSLHWNELWTQDPEASLAFYEKVLGYTHEEMTMPNGKYYIFKDGDQMRAGMLQAPSSDIPTMWLQYITVDDCDATLARAKKNGATVVAEPMDAEPGRFAILRDPLGGMIGVIKPANA